MSAPEGENTPDEALPAYDAPKRPMRRLSGAYGPYDLPRWEMLHVGTWHGLCIDLMLEDE